MEINQGQDYSEVSKTSDVEFKRAPEISIISINNMLMQYFISVPAMASHTET